MIHFTEIATEAASLATGALTLAAAKVRGSSVYLHHATHGRLYADRRLNRWFGELAGVLTLSIGFDEYRRIHSLHHGYRTFAQARTDEEAASLHARGFLPGRSRRALKRLFLWTPFDPMWHARQAWTRLKANFAAGPAARVALSWAVWGGLGALAVTGNCLPGLLGAMGVLLVAGSVGSYLELISRHRWNIDPPSTGKERQFELSHWRLPTPTVPDRWTLTSALRFAGSVLLKSLWRYVVVPGDLAHHAAHHLGWDAGAPTDGAPPKWTDAAVSYSDLLRADAQWHPHVFGSLLQAVDAGLDSLAAEQPSVPDTGKDSNDN